MDARARGLLEQGNPIGRRAAWPVILVEGGILSALGLYVLIDKNSAASSILQIIGTVLLIVSILNLITEYRVGTTDMVLFSTYRAGIGTAVGAIGAARWIWNDYIPDRPLRIILGCGLIAYALIHLVGLVVVRGTDGFRPAPVIMSLLVAVLGIVLLVVNDTNSNGALTLLGSVFLFFGVALIAFAIYRMRAANSGGGTSGGSGGSADDAIVDVPSEAPPATA